MKIILIALITIGPFFYSMGNEAGKKLLTKEQTIGYIFYEDALEDQNTILSFRSSLNPEAKKELLEILEDKNLEYQYSCTILFGLAYMIDAKDFPMIENAFMSHYKNDYMENISIYFSFLGEMAYRGTPEAKKKLMEMADMNYWNKLGMFFIKEKKVKIEYKLFHSMFRSVVVYYRNKTWLKTFSNKLIANMPEGKKKKELAEEISNILNYPDEYLAPTIPAIVPSPFQQLSEGDLKRCEAYYKVYQLYKEGKVKLAPNGHLPSIYGVISEYIAERKKADARRKLEEEKEESSIESFTDACDRIILGKGAATDIMPEEKELAEKAKKEALEAFVHIRDLFIAGSFDELDGKLLDNGIVLPSGSIKNDKGYERSIKIEQPVLIAIKDMTPNNYRVGISNNGNIVVSFTYPNTLEIIKANFKRCRTALTIENGQLTVFMRKIDGKWHWNPFGW